MLAGTCSYGSGDTYDDSMCVDARNGSQSLSCGSGGYPYYSCNFNGTNWEYCYGCHAVGGGGGDCPSSCTPDTDNDGCDNGEEPGTTAGGCQTPCPKDKNGKQKICCRATSCGNTCTNTPPGTPVQVSPVNNATVFAPVTLTWSPFSQWGEACSGGNNQLFVLLGTTNPPTTVYPTDNPTTFNFTTATPGATYYWLVRAHNGPTATDSPVWSFTVGACNNLPPTNVIVTRTPGVQGGYIS